MWAATDTRYRSRHAMNTSLNVPDDYPNNSCVFHPQRTALTGTSSSCILDLQKRAPVDYANTCIIGDQWWQEAMEHIYTLFLFAYTLSTSINSDNSTERCANVPSAYIRFRATVSTKWYPWFYLCVRNDTVLHNR